MDLHCHGNTYLCCWDGILEAVHNFEHSRRLPYWYQSARWLPETKLGWINTKHKPQPLFVSMLHLMFPDVSKRIKYEPIFTLPRPNHSSHKAQHAPYVRLLLCVFTKESYLCIKHRLTAPPKVRLRATAWSCLVDLDINPFLLVLSRIREACSDLYIYAYSLRKIFPSTSLWASYSHLVIAFIHLLA